MDFDRDTAIILKSSAAYRDLDTPVILTSGNIGIYFINTEKILQDGGAWSAFGEDAQAMMRHTIELMRQNGDFHHVVHRLVERVDQALPMGVPHDRILISGGQRRDWPFSQAVANNLGLKHVSWYKDGRGELHGPNGEPITRSLTGGDAAGLPNNLAPRGVRWYVRDFLKYMLAPQRRRPSFDLGDYLAIGVSDLQTTGSSTFDPRNLPSTGWFPMLWNAGATAYDAFTVVDRLQGAAEILHHAPLHGGRSPIRLEALVGITDEFLAEFSKDPERALAYHANPHEWSEEYIREHGIGDFVPAFDPNGSKMPRAGKFIGVFADVLSEDGAHLYRELQSEVKDRFDYDIAEREGMRLPSQARDI